MPDKPQAVLLIHGGAGTLDPKDMTAEREAGYREAIERALRAGYEALQVPGGSSLNAVDAAIHVLEDSPLFNAGKGSAFNREGQIEMDAALMEGRDLMAGAVAGVTRVKNPIAAARRVMEASGHVLLAGTGADRFVEEQGLATAAPDEFWTEHRWEEYQAKAREELPARGAHRFGTVGAVAIDREGNLAAGASTGGMTFKRPGRVGDSPLIGSGVYAENGVAAVSCTGDGEAFIRIAAAYQVIALVKYAGLSVAAAAARVIDEALPRVKGEGGLIALGADGTFALPFNSSGMYRGWVADNGATRVAIFPEGPDDQ